MRRPQVAAVAGILALVTTGSSAETPELVAGSRVRVRASSEQKQLVGTLLALDDRTLQLKVGDEEAPRVFSRAEIDDLDISAGRRSGWRRALYGTLAGAAVGAALVFATTDSDDEFIFTQEEAAGIGAFWGAAAGALVGILVIPAEKWRDVPLEDVQVSLRPTRRGAGVSVTLRF